jgi:hypothetical protein
MYSLHLAKKLKAMVQVWWHTSIVLACSTQEAEDQEIKASLGYVVRLRLKNKQANEQQQQFQIHQNVYNQNSHCDWKCLNNDCNSFFFFYKECLYPSPWLHVSHLNWIQDYFTQGRWHLPYYANRFQLLPQSLEQCGRAGYEHLHMVTAWDAQHTHTHD